MSTWVDLGDLYVKKAGDTVSGSILMANNNLSVAYDSDNLYNVGTEIKSLRDFVFSEKSGTLQKNNVYTINYYCHQHIGIASVIFSLQSTATWQSYGTSSTIPSKYRPSMDWSCAGFFNNSTRANGRIYINDGGQFCYQTLNGTFAADDQIRGTLMWYYPN